MDEQEAFTPENEDLADSSRIHMFHKVKRAGLEKATQCLPRLTRHVSSVRPGMISAAIVAYLEAKE